MQRIERMANLYPLLMGRLGAVRALVHEGRGLSYNQYKTLLTIADRQGCSLVDLARELEVAMSSASQMVDRLVGEGLVHREQDVARGAVNCRIAAGHSAVLRKTAGPTHPGGAGRSGSIV